MKHFSTLLVALACSSCAFMRTVRQEDLDAWRGQPVEKLDLHPLFSTMRLERHMTASGIEVRNYRNEGPSVLKGASETQYQRDTSSTDFTGTVNQVVCNNLFYVKDGVVQSYRPVGRCYTDESLQPQN
jgi:hypothetical protein